jgi:hypothetical protein
MIIMMMLVTLTTTTILLIVLLHCDLNFIENLLLLLLQKILQFSERPVG